MKQLKFRETIEIYVIKHKLEGVFVILDPRPSAPMLGSRPSAPRPSAPISSALGPQNFQNIKIQKISKKQKITKKQNSKKQKILIKQPWIIKQKNLISLKVLMAFFFWNNTNKKVKSLKIKYSGDHTLGTEQN